MVKCGLEIHQRLNTENKLFCNCKTAGSGRKVSEIKRKLHPVPSEMGEIDIAAQFEATKGRGFTYDIYENTVCEIDSDESPPIEINKEAILIALSLCKMIGANIIDEVQVMRKLVLDGSTPMSFQRTALVGLNGKVKTKAGEISIPTICLEEESAGIIGEVERAETGRYRLDRLGIPLIEIATSSNIKNGREAKEVAEKIGLMLRATGKVQRGIGTIRQDLNVSVEGGARVEVKGVQELDLIELVVDNEIKRQGGLVKLYERIKKLKKEKQEIKEVTEIFKKTGCKFIKEAIWRGEKVFVTKFSGMAGLFNEELYPGFRYGMELNGYAKAIGVGGIIHSDEDPKRYGFMEEIKEMEKEIGKKERDGWVIVVGSEEICKRTVSFVYERAYFTKVPEETRHALLNGGSEYMRPLPGAARLYPETDIPPLKIEKEVLKKIEVPDFEKLRKKFERILNKELAEKMIRSEYIKLFESFIEIGVEPMLIAITLEETIKAIRREGFDTSKITDEKLTELFVEYKNGLFVKAAIPEILKILCKKDEKIAKIVKGANLTRISGFELKKLIKEIKAKNVEDVMQKYRLRVDASELKELIK